MSLSNQGRASDSANPAESEKLVGSVKEAKETNSVVLTAVLTGAD
jgi:delta 1-pyrroline-5-carboxylate dehydrogenase